MDSDVSMNRLLCVGMEEYQPSGIRVPTTTPLFLPTRTVVTHTSNDVSVAGDTNPSILHVTTDCYSPDDTDTLSSIQSQNRVITIQLNEREEQLLTILRNVMDLYNHHPSTLNTQQQQDATRFGYRYGPHIFIGR
jgi:hypothetical protein